MNRNLYSTHFAQVNFIQTKLILAASLVFFLGFSGPKAYGEDIPEELKPKKEAPHCNNVTDGGVIGGSEIDCGSFNPGSVINVTSPSGGSGGLEYLWLKNSIPSGLSKLKIRVDLFG